MILGSLLICHALDPQWTPKIRPYVDTLDPANGRRVVERLLSWPQPGSAMVNRLGQSWPQSVKSQGFGDSVPKLRDEPSL